MDGGVSKWMVTLAVFPAKVFPNDQKWMVVWMVVFRVFPNGVSRSGWWCFQMDGGVSVFRNTCEIFIENTSIIRYYIGGFR